MTICNRSLTSRRRKVDCPYCDGGGEVFDSRRVHSRSLDPPMSKCPVCGGSGSVDEDEADEIDCDKSLAEYEEEYEAEAAEKRWEAQNDR